MCLGFQSDQAIEPVRILFLQLRKRLVKIHVLKFIFHFLSQHVDAALLTDIRITLDHILGQIKILIKLLIHEVEKMGEHIGIEIRDRIKAVEFSVIIQIFAGIQHAVPIEIFIFENILKRNLFCFLRCREGSARTDLGVYGNLSAQRIGNRSRSCRVFHVIRQFFVIHVIVPRSFQFCRIDFRQESAQSF